MRAKDFPMRSVAFMKLSMIIFCIIVEIWRERNCKYVGDVLRSKGV